MFYGSLAGRALCVTGGARNVRHCYYRRESCGRARSPRALHPTVSPPSTGATQLAARHLFTKTSWKFYSQRRSFQYTALPCYEHHACCGSAWSCSHVNVFTLGNVVIRCFYGGEGSGCQGIRGCRHIYCLFIFNVPLVSWTQLHKSNRSIESTSLTI